MMADFLSRLLNPNPIMNQSGGASPMPFPQMQPQEMQRPGFGQNFKSNIGPILQALGMGIASGDLGHGAAMLPALVDNRQQRQAQIMEQQEEQQHKNQTVAFFKSPQGDPQIASMLEQGVIDGKTAISMWQQKQQGAQPGNQPASIQEYEYAKQNGFEGSYMDFNKGKRNEGVTYSLNPQWYRVGNDWKFGVSGSDGSFKEVEIPEGVKLEGPEGVAAARARGGVVGKIGGEAQMQMPVYGERVARITNQVDAIINDPQLDSSVGPIQGRLPDLTAGRAAFAARVEQLKGQAFLAARQELKGGGAITDFEGQKAEMALNRASRSTNEDEYRAAMLEFKQAIINGYSILEQQAAGGGAAPAPAQQGGAEDPLGLR